MAALVWEMDILSGQQNTEKDICDMLGISVLQGYHVETPEAVCNKMYKCETQACVLTGSRKSACFEGVSTVIDQITGWE